MEREWTLGEVFILRHAGFPFDWVESLGVGEAFSAEVEALLDCEDALLAAARAKGTKTAERVAEALAAGRAPAPWSGAPAEALALFERWKGHAARLEEGYPAERQRLRTRLRELASDLQIQEAAFLSSPAMYENIWARYVKEPQRPESSDVRRIERQVYAYLQRFCAKNETTSFFGPMGYGEIEGEGEIEVKHLPPERRRRTFLSLWAIQEVAKQIARDKRLRAHLPLRVNPVFTFTPERADCSSLGISVELGDDARRVLAALERPRSLAELSQVLGTDLASVERMALPLLKNAVVARGLPFDTHAFEVLENFRRAVGALPEGEARAHWLAQIDRLDGLRAQFEAAGFPERIEALAALERAFTEITGQPARRGEGKMYSDRLVIYEEGGSPFRLRFGKAFARKLAQALSPGLELSAAFGERVQREYQQEIHDKVGAETDAIDFLSYAAKLRPDAVSGSQFSPVAPVPIAPAEGKVQALEALLPSSSDGGRFALPDVCISAELDAEGRPIGMRFLLARVHHHLLLWSWLCAFYEDRPRLESVAGRWLSGEPTAANLTGLALSRRNKGFYRFPGAKLAYTPAEAIELGNDGLRAASLRVQLTPQGPLLLDAEGQARRLYLPLADFSTYPPFAALAHPLVLHAPLRSGAPHIPRIELGGAVYQRERWEEDLTPLRKLSGLSLFLAVRRRARQSGWPRFLFGRVVSERKPFLLDTASPFAAELLRHLIHDDAQVIFEEMLPAADGLWLRDERGRYTFELRVQAERWSHPPPA